MSEEPPDEVMTSIGTKIQIMVQIATEASTTISNRRAEQVRAAAAQRSDRLRAELEAHKPVMRRVWDDRWWRNAEVDQITKTWEVCASWANNEEPYGRICLDEMREQIKARYGVDLAEPADSLSRSELAEVLGADRDAASPFGEGAEEPAGPERSVRYVIRDPQTGQEVASGDEDISHDHRPIELIAADRLRQFERSDSEREERTAPDRFVIDVYDSTQPGEEPTFTLAADDAESVREEVLQRHGRVVAGEEPVTPQERHDALLFERQRISEELNRLMPPDSHVEDTRENLAEHLNATAAEDQRAPAREPDDAGDLAPEEGAQRIVDLREQQARLGLRLQAAEAELSGENGAHVIEAAALRKDLDEDWWQTAAPEEVRAVYGHVERWDDGQAKRSMLAQLREDISRHHGIDLDRDAPADTIGQELFRAQAEARGEQVITYRIDAPGTDGRTESATGRTTAPNNEPARDTAQRLLGVYAGDLDQARERKLHVSLTDHKGRPITALAAEDLGQGPAGREAEERWANASDADADAERDAVTGAVQDRQEEPEVSPADERAAEERAEAEQERDAAAVLERMEQNDAEPVNAVRGAAKSLRHSLRRRLRHGTAPGETRAGSRGSGRVIGRQPKPEVER